MRRLWFCALCLAAAAAVAQTPGDQTGYRPLVAYDAIVPEIATVNVSNSPVGATNATGNNLAGARNSTIGNVPGLSYASISAPGYLQPFPTAESVREQSRTTTVSARLPGLSGSIRSPSAYSQLTDPLATVSLAQRAIAHRTAGHIYTNTELHRLAEQSARTGSVTLSTVQRTITTASESAQALHDRNLGLSSVPQEAIGQPRPPIK